MAKKLFYKIGEACKKVDVQPYVLRYWETEFDLLSPDKSKSGQRVYTDQDLAIIRRIKELLYDEGYTTVGAKKKLASEMSDPDSPLGSSDGQKSNQTSQSSGEDEAEDKDADASESPGSGSAESVESTESSNSSKAESAGDDAGATDASGDSDVAGDAAGGSEKALRAGVESALEQARELLDLLHSRRGGGAG